MTKTAAAKPRVMGFAYENGNIEAKKTVKVNGSLNDSLYLDDKIYVVLQTGKMVIYDLNTVEKLGIVNY